MCPFCGNSSDTKEKEGRPLADKNIIIGADAAEKLLERGDGLAALLYLHIRERGEFSLSAAGKKLRRSEAEISAAAAALREMGLLSAEKPLEGCEMPEYSAADIVSRAGRDSVFEGLVDAVQHALGRLLSTPDLRSLFGIYDHLGIPAEVIYLLVAHCIETYRESHGEGRMPTMRYIEKEAWYWAREEIMSLDAAEEHIKGEKERKSKLFRTAEMLQIKGRQLSQSERRYIESWLEMGFEPEALAVAYDRTVLGTGKLAWRYMDKIVSSWHEKGLHSEAEVIAGDPRQSKKQEKAAQSDDREIEDMRRMYAYMKGKEN
ncbi:MAG: DnaD domain protein [Ruminococcaceae bacterium]|nr:DnaD domain protein [Oscillospiraceae bacterium]